MRKPTSSFNFMTMVCAICFIATFFSAAQADGSGQPILDRVVIKINNQDLDTEIAVTPQQRHHGLSFRKTLGADSGMLFVYANEHNLLFTMRDTSIPLSIAFIGNDMVINQVLHMQPFQDGPYPSKFPSKFALEVNQGWFEQHGIKAGDKLQLEQH